MIHFRRSLVQFLLIIILVLSLAAGPASANTIRTTIIAPSVVTPGDIIWFDIIVTNLAPIYLDHATYYFSAGPFVDLIRIPPWGDFDESLHISSFYDSLALPPSYGTSHFFGDRILGRVRTDTPPSAEIISEFWILIAGDVMGTEGEWCYGCWQDYAASGKITTVVSDPVPVPEFPSGALPALFIACFIAFVALKKGGM